ncbi:MAG: M56 family metallopeptidase, partial [Paramuribaculum sp.]|nr:M56 family metallopeptidase [Paramuribaculum sp.]
MAAENQHSFNRFVLLVIYVVAFGIVPFMSLFEPKPKIIGPITVTGVGTISKSILPTVFLWIYITGMVLMTVLTMVNIFKLWSIVRRGRKIKRNGYTLIISVDSSVAPFSWMQYIVLPEKDFINGSEMIVCHEEQHIAFRHWVDLLVAQIVVILNWFNPAAWLMREELKTVHEYQADMGVIASGVDMKSYQMLLITKAVGYKFPGMANSLNHSKLKKRINMMLLPIKSPIAIRLRSFLLIPAIMLAWVAISTPVVASRLSLIRSSTLVKEKLPEGTVIVDFTRHKPASEPTIFLNGEQVAPADMNNINPKDIKAVTVRKDHGSG